MAETNTGGGLTTKRTAKDIALKARAQVAKMGQQASEFAARALTAERATDKLNKALGQAEMTNAELRELATAQNELVLQRTSHTHRAATDVGGMALALGVDLAAFEGMAALAARSEKVAKYQQYLIGAPHLLLGGAGYAAVLVHRSKTGGFPSMLVESAEDAAKHLIVLGASAYAKEALTVRK
jgi:hypothetical protein